MASESSEFPRPLTEREAATLRFMLSVEDPRMEALRKQAEFARVTGSWGCCASLDLDVDRGRASAASDLCYPVTEAHTREKADATRYHDLILFQRDGWLKTLELVHYAGTPPREFPPTDDFEPPCIACEPPGKAP
jgi:hypothetical protein